jgi:hypothetical protein
MAELLKLVVLLPLVFKGNTASLVETIKLESVTVRRNQPLGAYSWELHLEYLLKTNAYTFFPNVFGAVGAPLARSLDFINRCEPIVPVGTLPSIFSMCRCVVL